VYNISGSKGSLLESLDSNIEGNAGKGLVLWLGWIKKNLKHGESCFIFVGFRVCALKHIRCGPVCISLHTGNRCDKG
jgi:hypothetical protein